MFTSFLFQGVLRVLLHLKLRDFLCTIAETKIVLKEDGSVVVDHNRKPEPKKEVLPGVQNGQKKPEDDEEAAERRRKLMENMAQRWLQQEVRGNFGEMFGS